MNDVIEACCRCKIFKGLNRAEIQHILSMPHYQVKTYDQNEFICREDQTSAYIGIIVFGCVEIQKILPSGNSVCLFYRNKGDMFGGAVVFAGKATYPCDVFSRDKSKILFLSKTYILKMCRHHLIANNLLTAFADSIFNFEKKVELFSYSSIQKKIAFYLLDELKASASPKEILLEDSVLKENMVRLPFTKKAWAEYLGVSRPSLCRELKKLSNDNIIEINRNAISIKKKKKLLDLLQQ